MKAKAFPIIVCMALLAFLALPAVAMDGNEEPLSGYLYTMNGEKQKITAFLNLADDYEFVHDAMSRRVPVRDIKSIERWTSSMFRIKIRGRNKARAYPHRYSEGFPFDNLVRNGATLNYEYYDKIIGKVIQGHIACKDIKKIVFN